FQPAVVDRGEGGQNLVAVLLLPRDLYPLIDVVHGPPGKNLLPFCGGHAIITPYDGSAKISSSPFFCPAFFKGVTSRCGTTSKRSQRGAPSPSSVTPTRVKPP